MRVSIPRRSVFLTNILISGAMSGLPPEMVGGNARDIEGLVDRLVDRLKRMTGLACSQVGLS